ncbi:hypothetical protein ACFY0N_00775 [Streptomyces vinaceus]|uniref:hypothetical protein n=1 Tax=Streptomyces vinaceus TaxID=1960 RepID=UPI00369EF85A
MLYEPDPEIFRRALAYGIHGDDRQALLLLDPIVNAGPRHTYGLLLSLAEVASKPARDATPPGQGFFIEVDGPDGEPASIDVLPPPLRFALRFMAAYANRDAAMTYAVFMSVGDPAVNDGPQAFADCIRALYRLAVKAAGEQLAAARAAKTTPQGQ